MNEEERIIHKKSLISVFAMFIGLFCLANSVLTVYLYKIDAAGTAELKSGYMVKSMKEPSLWQARTDIFKTRDTAEVRTDSQETRLIADILKETADENGLELSLISFYDQKGRHITDFRSK
ncbi:MAG: hypothetical protein J5758_01110 [Abditibacteriota bacterium]|nr:hypothetical protein [Abditibacteriota bacterium]